MRLDKTVLIALLTLVASTLSMVASEGWMTNIEEAKKVGQKTGKSLFIEFTGSDWCPPCIMMQKNVFSKKKFTSEAKKKYILVKIDIPSADKALKEKNEKVMKKYKVSGVPTILLMDAKGKEFSRFSASRYNTVKKMLAKINRQLRIKGMF